MYSIFILLLVLMWYVVHLADLHGIYNLCGFLNSLWKFWNTQSSIKKNFIRYYLYFKAWIEVSADFLYKEVPVCNCSHDSFPVVMFRGWHIIEEIQQNRKYTHLKMWFKFIFPCSALQVSLKCAVNYIKIVGSDFLLFNTNADLSLCWPEQRLEKHQCITLTLYEHKWLSEAQNDKSRTVLILQIED